VAAGTVLGSYRVRIPAGYRIPLGPTAPTQSQILANTDGDLIWRPDLGGAPISPAGGDTMLSLSNGSTPTFDACTTDTLVINSAPSTTRGTAFCLLETTGMVAGVKVVNSSFTAPSFVELDVVIWQKA
jgi:hypothetical protein